MKQVFTFRGIVMAGLIFFLPILLPAQEIQLAIQKKVGVGYNFLCVDNRNRLLFMEEFGSAQYAMYDLNKNALLWTVKLGYLDKPSFSFNTEGSLLFAADRYNLWVIDVENAKVVQHLKTASAKPELFCKNKDFTQLAYFRSDIDTTLISDIDAALHHQLSRQRAQSILLLALKGQKFEVTQEIPLVLDVRYDLVDSAGLYARRVEDKKMLEAEFPGLHIGFSEVSFKEEIQSLFFTPDNSLTAISTANVLRTVHFLNKIDKNGRLVFVDSLPGFDIFQNLRIDASHSILVLKGQSPQAPEGKGFHFYEAGTARQLFAVNTDTIPLVQYSADGRFLLTLKTTSKDYFNQENELNLIEAATQRNINTINWKSMASSAASKTDKNLNFQAIYKTSGRKLEIIDLRSGEVKYNLPSGPASFVWSNQGDILFYATTNEGAVARLNLKSGITKEAGKKVPESIFSTLCPADSALYTSISGKLFRLSLADQVTMQPVASDFISQFWISGDKKIIARVGYDTLTKHRYLFIDSLGMGRPFRQIPLQQEGVPAAKISPDNRFIAIMLYGVYENTTRRTRLLLFDIYKNKIMGIVPLNPSFSRDDSFAWTDDGEALLVSSILPEAGKPLKNAYDAPRADQYLSLGMYSSQKSFFHKINVRTGAVAQIDSITPPIYTVSASGRYIGKSERTNAASRLRIVVTDYRLSKRYELDKIEETIFKTQFHPDDSSLMIYTYEVHLSESAKITYSAYRWNFKRGTVEKMFNLPDDFGLSTVYFHQQYMILVYGSGKNVFYSFSGKQKVLEVTVKSNGNFIMVNPENYYYATKGAIQEVRFTKGTNSIPFRQYDLLFNRPDKVLTALPQSNPEVMQCYYKAYQKRLQKTGFREEDLSVDAGLPALKTDALNLPAETEKPVLDLTVEASDANYLLDRINIWVNDVPIFGSSGISLRDKKTQMWSQKVSIHLSQGKNQITLSCLNAKGVESLLEEIIITHTPVAPQKPDLYVLAIGVSAYQNSQVNLQYAAKDAKDISTVFATRKDLYGQIFTKTILDEEVTANNVRAAKAWLKQSRTDDRVIVFVSGHGLLDKDLNYYLATHDINFAKPEAKGLPFDALDQLLDSIPARQKLLLMDACHSGELDKENVTIHRKQTKTDGNIKFRAINTGVQIKQIGLQNSFELMKELFVDLRRSSGATILSSAGGAEYAMEGDRWKNGVFTFSLLEGMQNKAADADKDGSVLLSELQEYLNKRVFELTEGRQKPTFRAENITNDWRIW